MSFQSLMKPKEVVEGVWLDTMKEEGRTQLTLLLRQKAQAEKGPALKLKKLSAGRLMIGEEYKLQSKKMPLTNIFRSDKMKISVQALMLSLFCHPCKDVCGSILIDVLVIE